MTKATIQISSELKEKFPALRLGVLRSGVVVSESSDELKDEMARFIQDLSGRIDAEVIRNMPVVDSFKSAYRVLGKDPNRYRPSAEYLLRRVSSGKGLYEVNNVVDCLNFTSIRTGFSICGYDIHKIDGPIAMGIGEIDEPYCGIGRGQLNISYLPVFRDLQGAFGTPTSDSVRTMIEEESEEVLFLFPDFDHQETLEEALRLMSELLHRFVKGADPVYRIL